MVQSITKKSSLQMKKCLLWRKLSISKMIQFIHGHPWKPANSCQRSNEVITMVWWGVSYDGNTLHFYEKGVKTVARNYQQDILTNVVEPLNHTIFQSRPWIFQPDSVHAHKAKSTQQWLVNHVPKFINSDH
jgi:hypothetical protein